MIAHGAEKTRTGGQLPLTENGQAVLERRYLRRGADGAPIETPEAMFRRVAHHIALVEEDLGGDAVKTESIFFKLLTEFRFFPNSPTFTGAGTPLGQLAACFVLPINDDMGRDSSGIFQTLRNAALIQQTGGGNGFSFSRLRPAGTLVHSSAGQATGPIGFLRVYDQAFEEIAQGGVRRGANMAVLNVGHPDVLEFVTCKTDENAITNFNISVGISDSFMRAVENDEVWQLAFPDVNHPDYPSFHGTINQAYRMGLPIKVHRQIPARELFHRIAEQAHHNGEPGVLFLDAMNRDNPVPHLYELEATNPCGEQALGPYENCCLGSINLAHHVTTSGKGELVVDWALLKASIEQATRFLDNVVDANSYVPAVPQLREAALRARRIGLGIMGLGDMMFHLGIRYGSRKGQEFASQIIEYLRYHAMLTSVELAKERGPFPAIKGSRYDPENLTWTSPQPLVPHLHDWGRPELNWDQVVSGIREHGIRNAAQTTIAPTGTIATVAGCEAYGCEPSFALAYVRHVNDGGKDLQLTYTSPLFLAALERAGLDEATRERIVEQVVLSGSCQGIAEVPKDIRETFVVAGDLSVEEHVRMQAALQAFVDNCISKTINAPASATVEDVEKAYMLAWELGCKGLTIYVTGSREKVVLETRKTAASDNGHQDQVALWPESKKPRPQLLPGKTYRIGTPSGTTFITVNENGHSQPFEVFIHTSKAGSETNAVAEATGRLISYLLRLRSPVSPRARLVEVVRQLIGIGGGRSLGFGPNRVLSLPDGIAQSLDQYLGEASSREPALGSNRPSEKQQAAPGQITMRIGDLCPDCGQAAVVNEEGCRKCYYCGYSEC
jgi:ribonucleoside-diphosphate reductase alpha chain